MSHPKDVDVVFKPWQEFHSLMEDRKEAVRLLRMALAAAEKNKPLDQGQIRQFLDRISESDER